MTLAKTFAKRLIEFHDARATANPASRVLRAIKRAIGIMENSDEDLRLLGPVLDPRRNVPDRVKSTSLCSNDES